MDVNKRIAYTQRIIRGFIINKYKRVLVELKETEKGVDGDQWTLIPTKDVTM